MRRTQAPLLPPAVAYAALTACAVIVPVLASGLTSWTSDRQLIEFFTEHNGAAHASAFFTLGASIPFAVVTAVATSRLRTLGLDVPGRMIALVGGTVAAALLALAGLSTLALTRDHVADSPAVIRAFNALAFAAGGPGFVVFQGLLLAGISIAALMGRVLPRTLGWAGVGLAIVSELASLTAAFDSLDFLLPIARFGAAAWLIAIGVLLPATKRELREHRGIVRDADLAGAAH